MTDPVQPTSEAQEQPSQLGGQSHLTETELKNMGTVFAVQGVPVDGASQRIAALFEMNKQQVLFEFAPLKQDAAGRRAIATSRLVEARALEASLDRVKAEREVLVAEERTLQGEVSALLSEVIRLRSAAVSARLEALSKRFLPLDPDEMEARFDIAKRIHDLEHKEFETNRAGLQHRADALVREQQLIEGEIKESADRVRQLQEVGVTKTIAGFLAWAGYTSLGGVGLVVSSLLQARETSEQLDPLSFLWKLLDGISPGAGPQRLALLMLCFFLLLPALVFGYDRLLRWFDTSWLRSRSAKGKNRRKSQPEELFGLSVPRIERHHFVQLLASLPYVFVVVALLAVLSSQQISDTATAGQDFGVGLSTAYIGAAYVLLSTCAALLYGINVIEPRRQRLRQQAQTGAKVSVWRMHWEFPLVLLLALAGSALLSLMPGSQDKWAWGGVSLFMLLGTISIAYGIIYKGTFKDLDVLTRTRLLYEERIEDLLVPPFFSFSTEPDDDPKRRSRDGVEREIVKLARLYPVQALFSTEDEDTAVAARLLRAFSGQPSGGWLQRWRARQPEGEAFRILDHEVAPTQVQAAIEKRAVLRAKTEQRQSLDRQEGEIGSRLAALDARALADQIEQIKAEIARYEAEEQRRIASLDALREKQMLILETSYYIASFVAEKKGLKAGTETPSAPPN